MKVFNIIVREFCLLRQEPKLLLFILGVPILYALLFGSIYSNKVVKDMPIVICDADQSKISRMIIQAFDDSEKFRIVGQVTENEQAEKMVADKRAVAALFIPENFSRDLKKGQAREALIVANGANMIYANSIVSSASEIIQTMSAGVAVKALEGAGQLPFVAQNKAALIQFRMRILHNPTFNYQNFLLVGLLLTILQQAVMLTVALAMIKEYRRLEELEGIPAVVVVLGKMVVYWLLGMVSLVIALMMGHYIFDVPWKSGVDSVMGLGAVFLAVIVCVGFVFSAVCPDELTATQYSMLYATPAFLFSGFTWPREAMSQAAIWISSVMPITYVADNVRDLMLAGYAPQLRQSVIVLMIFLIASFVGATAMFAFKRREARSVGSDVR